MRDLLDPAGEETLIHQQNNRNLSEAIGGAETSIADHETRITALEGLADTYTANASSSLTLTTTPTDITGATVTLVDVGTYLVIGAFDMEESVDGAGALTGRLVVDGSAQTGEAEALFDTIGEATICRAWIVTTAGTSKVAKLQASKGIAGGTASALQTNTNITAVRIA